MALSSTLVKSTGVAALGGLLFGFDTAVISGTTRSLTDVYHLTPYLLGVTVFSAILGTIFGSMFAGIPGEKYGRRDSLRVLAILYLVSALGCAFAWNWSALVFFRFIGGLGIGGSSVSQWHSRARVGDKPVTENRTRMPSAPYSRVNRLGARPNG